MLLLFIFLSQFMPQVKAEQDILGLFFKVTTK